MQPISDPYSEWTEQLGNDTPEDRPSLAVIKHDKGENMDLLQLLHTISQ
jgi:hypothetical protein